MGHSGVMLASSPALPHHKVREGAGGTGNRSRRAGLTRARAPACAGISPSLKGRGYSSRGIEEPRLVISFPRARTASGPTTAGRCGKCGKYLEKRVESTEFRAGRAEGVRNALAIVEALMAAEELKLEQPASYATRTARRTRWQAYRNAASRLRTMLNRLTKDAPVSAEIEAKLKRMGL